MNLADIMNRRFHFAHPATKIWIAQMIMLRYQEDFLVVVDDDDDEKLVGIITHSDIFRKLLPKQEDYMEKQEHRIASDVPEEHYRGVCQMTVGELMTKKPLTIQSHIPVFRAGALMNARKIKQLPIVDKGKLVGVISYGDIHLALMLKHGTYGEFLKDF